MCQQAQVYCTQGRAKKVTAAMLLIGFTASTVAHSVRWVVPFGTTPFNVVFSIYFILFSIIVPVSVLVINVIVVREVRRAANNAAVNLGLQQHQQSTSSNSVVPTVMLVITSLIYVVLNGTVIALFLINWWVPGAAFGSVTWVILHKAHTVAEAAYSFVFSYNFFVYLITGKQFRCELHKFICRCRSAAAEAAADAVRVPTQRADLADTAV